MMEENYAALVISKENMCAQNIKEATTLDKVGDDADADNENEHAG